MNDKKCTPCGEGFKEAVCIHTEKVYDSCRDKDCLENIRVYLTGEAQSVVNNAINVKCTKAEIIWVFSDIEAVPFNRGYYSVDLKYFFKITLAVFTGVGRPCEVEGLATFDKKVILFGSEGNAKIFESKYKEDAFDAQLWKKTNMPNAIVEVADYKMQGRGDGVKWLRYGVCRRRTEFNDGSYMVKNTVYIRSVDKLGCKFNIATEFIYGLISKKMYLFFCLSAIC